MNRLFRTFFIFLLLLTTRGAVAQTPQVKANPLTPTNYNQLQSSRSELEQLNELQDFRSALPVQPSNDFDELMQLAQQAQVELGEMLSKITQRTQTHAIIPAVKSYDRAQEKITHKHHGEVNKITDLARASIVADDVESLMFAYKQLLQQGDVVQLKNRFAQPKASGYRDLNALIKLPKTQMVVEVQLHLHNIADIKSGPEHDAYVDIQQMQALAKAQHRPLSEMELAKITQLRQQAHKLYHKAWLTYKRQSIQHQSIEHQSLSHVA